MLELILPNFTLSDAEVGSDEQVKCTAKDNCLINLKKQKNKLDFQKDSITFVFSLKTGPEAEVY